MGQAAARIVGPAQGGGQRLALEKSLFPAGCVPCRARSGRACWLPVRRALRSDPEGLGSVRLQGDEDGHVKAGKGSVMPTATASPGFTSARMRLSMTMADQFGLTEVSLDSQNPPYGRW